MYPSGVDETGTVAAHVVFAFGEDAGDCGARGAGGVHVLVITQLNADVEDVGVFVHKEHDVAGK